ncbi:MAG: 4-hydroxy-tetrahydrodipicolinate reductase [Clostridia bacterium]|nr:4-hydroxy-tetrahydrodipicolinate reductase [Clostridia bacterium]
MLKIILSGCNGKMGRVITDIINKRNDAAIVAGVDLDISQNGPFPVFNNFNDITVDADVIIDFSHPAVLTAMLDFAKAKKLAAVIATTGFSAEQIDLIKASANEIPVFFSFNMSLGINLLAELCRKAATILEGFDIEIIEKHHNQKIDAPSGTAILLANEINDELGGKMDYEYDRHSKREKRGATEIGIHAIRGGTIVGEHDVIFAGRDEIITLSHSARSKEVFAVGAVNAAFFINGKNAGMYSMKELVAEK